MLLPPIKCYARLYIKEEFPLFILISPLFYLPSLLVTEFTISRTTAQKVIKFWESGIIDPPKKRRKDAIPEDHLQLAREFYLKPYISRELTGK